jgi:hypothetical protein
MIESARKEPTKYTEGVILSTEQQVLFRNVPPPLALAFAMTEGHEKAERRRIMEAHGCTELEAAFHVARRIASQDLLAKKASQSTGADSKATGNQATGKKAKPADEEAPDAEDAEDADALDGEIVAHVGESV